MRRTRRIVGGVGALMMVAAFAAGVVLGAVQQATLSLQQAPAGTTVTLHVAMTVRFDETQPGTLVMVPAHALDTSRAGHDCDEIAGSAVVGEMTWQMGTVPFGDAIYDGFVGDATFVVPNVPPGSYYLGETIPAIGTRCHTFSAFEVTAGQLPDTAMTGTPRCAQHGEAPRPITGGADSCSE